MKPQNLLEGYVLRGYQNLTPNDVDRRNERFRLIAFQNIQNFSNRSSINIFLCRRKLIEKPEKSESDLRGMSVYRRFKVITFCKMVLGGGRLQMLSGF